MATERWEKVKEVFAGALELQGSERGAYLAASCAADEQLRMEVESLLASYEPGFIERPAEVEATGGVMGLLGPRPLPGSAVGAYRLTRAMAEGGMGTVYEAVRADDQYQQRVAVKVMSGPGMRDPARRAEMLRRFRVERQTLANLNHPHICRLLDGGTTVSGAGGEGVPYLVMEYIDGRPIDEYCDAERMGTVQRLELFRKVCEAVAYAHRNLVVHRDIKPGNILITPEGTPKLLDFGIAKLLGESGEDGTDITRADEKVMTPGYASPEQVLGKPVTTSSDVYSLGVVLYLLLTGHRPYPVGGRASHEVAKLICEHEPSRPSTVVTETEEDTGGRDGARVTLTPEGVSRARDGTPARLRNRLRGDLDMILLGALRKEPERRYQSVEQLAEDIRRHLEGLPVTVRGDTVWYRTTRFVKRHSLGVMAGATVVLALVTGLAGTTWQAQAASEARDEAEVQLGAATTNLERATRAEETAQEEAATANELADFMVEIFRAGDPLRRAPGLRGGDTEPTAGEILQRGAEEVGKRLRNRPQMQARLLDGIGRAYRNLGKYDEAEKHLRTAVALGEKAWESDDLHLATIRNSLGVLLFERKSFDEAEQLFTEALRVRRLVKGEEDDEVAATMSDLGAVLSGKGELERARDQLERALEVRRKRLNPASPAIANTLNNLADVVSKQGDDALAEELFREAQQIYRKILAPQNPANAIALHNLAKVRQDLGDYEGADPMYQGALEICRAGAPSGHPYIAYALIGLASLRREQGRLDEAREMLEEARSIRRARAGERSVDVATCSVDLACVLSLEGKHEEALAMLGAAVEILRTKGGALDRTGALGSLGAALVRAARAAEAEPVLREALAARRRIQPRHWRTAEAASWLGECVAAQGRAEGAEALLLEAYAALRAARGDAHQATVRARGRLADLYEAWGKPERAAEYR